MKKSLVIIVLILGIFVTSAYGKEAEKRKFKLGVGVGSSVSEYEAYAPLVLPFPMIEYDDNLFYVRGFRGGVKVFSDEYNELSVFVQYDTQSFYNSRTGNTSLSRLDNRYSSLFSGVNYNFKSEYGIFNISGMTDVLGVNNGTIVDASYAFPFVFAHVALVPMAGLKYADSAYNDYYYGISHGESRKSHLREYRPIYSFSPYVGLSANITVFDTLDLSLYSRLMLLDNTIQSSPMVDKEAKFSFGGMVNYTF